MGRAGLRFRTAAVVAALMVAGTCLAPSIADAASKAPKMITIGQVTSTSGSYALQSGQSLAGLTLWVDQVNKEGGAYVGAYHKRIKVKLITYNAESNPATAATLYSNLITQDHVTILSADYGSVMTAPAVAIARDHKQLLFTANGTGAAFYTPGNPYIVLTSAAVEATEEADLANFLVTLHLKNHLKNVAILYDENEFNESQATAVKAVLDQHHVSVSYYQGTPTTTTSYSSIISSIAASKPDALIEFGFLTNDIAFLNQLHSSGQHFNFVYTYAPGEFASSIVKDVSPSALAYTFSEALPPLVAFNKTVGYNTAQFVKVWKKKYGTTPADLNLQGYSEGVVIQVALQYAKTLTQLGLREALAKESGKFTTLFGPFKIQSTGAQVGLSLPVTQLFPQRGSIDQKIVFPKSYQQAKYVYPAPAS
jgi:branched-chain amino acid transport system substrate-binding protein